jgi:hypothetical protein
MTHKEDRTSINWLQHFTDKHNEGYFPPRIRSWMNEVDSSHSQIRNILGGDKIVLTFELKNIQDKAEDCNQLLKEILLKIPYYLVTYGFSIDDLKYPIIKPYNAKNPVRTIKHILTYAEKNNSPNLEIIKKLTNKLGEEYAKAKTENKKVAIVLSTTPQAFALLGHYGVDKDSCFGQRGVNSKHKFVLATVKNTFVITIRDIDETGKYPEDEFAEQDKCPILGRMWGFLDAKDRVLNICNYYGAKGFLSGNAIRILKKTAAKVLMEEENKINLFNNMIEKIDRDVIYHNYQKHDMSFSPNKQIEEQVLEI